MELHQPVLVDEVLRALSIELNPDGVYVDATLGLGGHSLEIVKRLGASGLLIGLDVDPLALERAGQRLQGARGQVEIVRSSYADLDLVLERLSIPNVQGVLLDLGISSYQLEVSGRGFSFSRDEPLDMRMDPSKPVTAEYLVNKLSERELGEILKRFGEEPRAKSIARAIVREREKEPIRTTSQLVKIVESHSPPRARLGKHPATRTFQALRIATNRELENLKSFLEKIPGYIAKGGRLVILSYHSLEHRMVKQAMVEWEKGCTCPKDLPQCLCNKKELFRRINRKAIKPTEAEVRKNPRARSAQLRAAERV